ncbi:MAG: DUF4783 domain-containing protein [Thermoflexibacter sp.]|jgi:hypothetical protein|nr:DUF4783 domain-containing protein [Thermoflexibacter sp.]
MKLHIPQIIFLLFLFFPLTNIYGQEEVISNAKLAIKSGSSKDLTKHFYNTVELKISANDNEPVTSNNCSKTQAEYVFKNFFKDYYPQDFTYVHQGTSKDGMKYAIGKYTYKDSTGKVLGSFRVFMKLKVYDGTYLIDEIDFSKE